MGVDRPVAGPPAPAVGETAEPGQRLLARVADTLIVGVPVVLLTHATLPQATAEIVASVGLAGLLMLYESVQLARWGQTLGKRLAGVAVVPAGPQGPEDGPLGLGRAVLRSAVYALPIAARPVPVLGAMAGVFWVANAALLFERPRRQALHDRVARTLVVRVRSGR
ncbi:RDD family protein [Actinomadura alba]|uniref:RDD family protein n=1 Tax=Actinomadura alba TaxID=406431 RepID=A0ABR7LSY8_9ACTN|nr:RDD family protein [Actinomadura alba]MBC6467963.1 RDD family protein [Actinomadura alba]